MVKVFLCKVMAILEVIKMGNPTLRKQSKPVGKELLTKEFQCFLNDLVDTMRQYKGVGIAASQVNVLKRVFAMEVNENSRYPNKKNVPLCVVINPEIEFQGHELVDSWEGCLSIPGIRGKLKRHQKILLRGLNIKGVAFENELEGFPAIIAQHELDHLNGKLLVDRMDSMETLSFQKEYEEYWAKPKQ